MKAVNLTNRILKAALLLIMTTTITFGQSNLLKAGKKDNLKRTYNCKHVGKQKVSSKKFTKKEASAYVAPVRTKKAIDTYNNIVESDNELYASAFTAEIKKVEENTVEFNNLPLPTPVYFRFDTDSLTYEDLRQIVLAIEYVKLGKNVILEGHTDSHGSNEYNKVLSLRRANKIKTMMVEMGGVSEEMIAVKYYGEEKPASHNDDHENRQLNRRVEFIVLQ